MFVSERNEGEKEEKGEGGERVCVLGGLRDEKKIKRFALNGGFNSFFVPSVNHKYFGFSYCFMYNRLLPNIV